jgi:hypothetical protein
MRRITSIGFYSSVFSALSHDSFNAQTATIENGFVYLPREAPWLTEYLHEIRRIPRICPDNRRLARLRGGRVGRWCGPGVE